MLPPADCAPARSGTSRPPRIVVAPRPTPGQCRPRARTAPHSRRRPAPTRAHRCRSAPPWGPRSLRSTRAYGVVGQPDANGATAVLAKGGAVTPRCRPHAKGGAVTPRVPPSRQGCRRHAKGSAVTPRAVRSRQGCRRHAKGGAVTHRGEHGGGRDHLCHVGRSIPTSPVSRSHLSIGYDQFLHLSITYSHFPDRFARNIPMELIGSHQSDRRMAARRHTRGHPKPFSPKRRSVPAKGGPPAPDR